MKAAPEQAVDWLSGMPDPVRRTGQVRPNRCPGGGALGNGFRAMVSFFCGRCRCRRMDWDGWTWYVFWLIGDAGNATAGQPGYRLAITCATKI